MLGRSKPVATRSGSRRPSRRATSRATRGVAVAVEATSARAPSVARGVGEAEVVGPEVVPPLRDAVRLVDHEQADAHLAHALEEAGRGEALGRHVEQAQVTRRGAREHARRSPRRPAAR